MAELTRFAFRRPGRPYRSFRSRSMDRSTPAVARSCARRLPSLPSPGSQSISSRPEFDGPSQASAPAHSRSAGHRRARERNSRRTYSRVAGDFFRPGIITTGRRYIWEIGTAGSTTMLGLSILPVLAFALSAVNVELRGGLFQDYVVGLSSPARHAAPSAPHGAGGGVGDGAARVCSEGKASCVWRCIRFESDFAISGWKSQEPWRVCGASRSRLIWRSEK